MAIGPGTKERLMDVVSSCRNEILDFTKALIQVPTENPPGSSYRDCVAVVEAKLEEIGLESSVLEVPAGRNQNPRNGRIQSESAYCLMSFYGTGPRTLYFHGHYDVVPAATPRQFKPLLKGDRLFGRGSADMKGGLAAMIYAVKAIKACKLRLNGRIGLAIVPDEETGGLRGSHALAASGKLGKDGIGMFTAEPTGGAIWNACRGAISLRVTVKGKPSHVGLHFWGVNSFEKMLGVANKLMELKQRVESRKTAFKIEPDEARNSILLIGGECQGGASFNTVPAQCCFTVDRRINPEEDLGAEKERLLELFDRFRKDGTEVEVETLQEARPAGFSEHDPVARALSTSIEAVTGKAPSFEMCPGLLETRFYAEQGVPAFAYGPGQLTAAHAPDESVALEDICACAAVYTLAAAELLA